MIRDVFVCIGKIFDYLFNTIFGFIDIIFGTNYVVIDGHKLPKEFLDLMLYGVNYLLTIVIIIIILVILFLIMYVLYNRFVGWLNEKRRIFRKNI